MRVRVNGDLADLLDLPGDPRVLRDDAGVRVVHSGGSVLLAGLDAADLTTDLFI